MSIDWELLKLLEADADRAPGRFIAGEPQAVVELLNAGIDEQPADPARAWPADEEGV